MNVEQREFLVQKVEKYKKDAKDAKFCSAITAITGAFTGAAAVYSFIAFHSGMPVNLEIPYKFQKGALMFMGSMYSVYTIHSIRRCILAIAESVGLDNRVLDIEEQIGLSDLEKDSSKGLR